MRRVRSFLLLFVAVLFWSLETAPLAAQTSPTPDAPREAESRPIASPPRPFQMRVSGHVGLTSFTAADSFDAVLGTSSGLKYGGGAGLLIGRHLFVDVQLSRFAHDGERVFVTPDRQVLQLGIPLRAVMMPVDVSAGWRFPFSVRGVSSANKPGYQIVPFVAGGAGVVRYEETADFADAGDNINETFTSYHALGGAEFPIAKGFGVNGEALYRWVPDALGEAGASQAFGETDLGGLTVRVRGTFTF